MKAEEYFRKEENLPEFVYEDKCSIETKEILKQDD